MFSSSELGHLERLVTEPDDEGLRQVLADALLERGAAYGELLMLSAQRRELKRWRELERTLAPQLRQALTPWAAGIVLRRGLPHWSLVDANRIPSGVTWPMRAVRVSGDFRLVLPMLQQSRWQWLESLDLSELYPGSQFTMWISGAPPPIPALPRLRSLRLMHGALPPHWHDVLPPAFANVERVSLGPDEGGGLDAWALELPRVKTLNLVLNRAPPSEQVMDEVFRWASTPGRSLEWCGRAIDVPGLRAKVQPGLPPVRPPLPDDGLVQLPLGVRSARLVQQGGLGYLRTDDVHVEDALTAPTGQYLVKARRPVLAGHVRWVEFEEVGTQLPLERQEPKVVLQRLEALVEALQRWWGHGAPDVLLGEWVGLCRDQLRLRGGELAVVPVLTRRMGDTYGDPPDFAGVPFVWSELNEVIVRIASTLAFEWLTGLPYVDTKECSFVTVHAKLLHQEAPKPSWADPSLARFDSLVGLEDERVESWLARFREAVG